MGVTERKLRSNRANSRASTGPRTTAGKLRAALNARRHGLNVPIWRDPEFAHQIEIEAERLVGPDADYASLDRARAVGEAKAQLARVHAYKRQLTTHLRSEKKETDRPSLSGDRDSTNSMDLPDDLPGIVSKLAAVERYAQRAWSRYKTAIREFDAVVKTAPTRSPSTSTTGP
jgi:hypothetical protein